MQNPEWKTFYVNQILGPCDFVDFIAIPAKGIKINVLLLVFGQNLQMSLQKQFLI